MQIAHRRSIDNAGRQHVHGPVKSKVSVAHTRILNDVMRVPATRAQSSQKEVGIMAIAAAVPFVP